MIKSLELKCFRKHEDLSLDFSAGLNVLRGPNEIGKTTITEGFLYCLYGTAALVDKLEDVVTWGHKETALKASMIMNIAGIDYYFVRSKAGAECNYIKDDQVVKVTGQKEVTAFSATLLGADAKTAGVLMLASQSGLRGALDEGPTAVGTLMSKLADFDTIDQILQAAAETLALGSEVPLTQKLTEFEIESNSAKEALVSEEYLQAARKPIAVLEQAQVDLKTSVDAQANAVNSLSIKRDEAISNNTSYDNAEKRVLDTSAHITSLAAELNKAELESAVVINTEYLESLRQSLKNAENYAQIKSAFNLYQSIPAYPDVAWDEPKQSFMSAYDTVLQKKTSHQFKLQELNSNIANLKKQVIKGDGKCPTCGTLSANHQHTLELNAATELKIKEATELSAAEAELLVEAETELAVYNKISDVAAKREAVCSKIFGFLKIDDSVYPAKVEWNGLTVAEEAPDIKDIRVKIAAIEAQAQAAAQAAGRAQAHRQTLALQDQQLKQYQSVLAQMKVIPVEPLMEAYDAAYDAYLELQNDLTTLSTNLQDQKDQVARLEMHAKVTQDRYDNAEKRIAEIRADLMTLAFNNELVKKLKSMKPMITDHLWNQVLAAVSNYFSTLRGEKSIVSKDAGGFKVNGRGGSLSGSTLDVLALSIRVALSKTFVPHANFMVLDEPAHGCDTVRTSNLLGFLAGVGFEQTILASHDELSEAVADNVITLGA